MILIDTVEDHSLHGKPRASGDDPTAGADGVGQEA